MIKTASLVGAEGNKKNWVKKEEENSHVSERRKRKRRKRRAFESVLI